MSMALSSRVLPADQWHRLPPGVPKLVVYTAFFYFSTMFFGELASARHCIFRCLKLLKESLCCYRAPAALPFALLHRQAAIASALSALLLRIGLGNEAT